MEPLATSYGDLLTKLGPSLSILAYFGKFQDCRETIPYLNKEIKGFWDKNERPFKVGLGIHRRTLDYMEEFDSHISEFLLENNRYHYYRLELTIDSKTGGELFLNFMQNAHDKDLIVFDALFFRIHQEWIEEYNKMIEYFHTIPSFDFSRINVDMNHIAPGGQCLFIDQGPLYRFGAYDTDYEIAKSSKKTRIKWMYYYRLYECSRLGIPDDDLSNVGFDISHLELGYSSSLGIFDENKFSETVKNSVFQIDFAFRNYGFNVIKCIEKVQETVKVFKNLRKINMIITQPNISGIFSLFDHDYVNNLGFIEIRICNNDDMLLVNSNGQILIYNKTNGKTLILQVKQLEIDFLQEGYVKLSHGFLITDQIANLKMTGFKEITHDPNSSQKFSPILENITSEIDSEDLLIAIENCEIDFMNLEINKTTNMLKIYPKVLNIELPEYKTDFKAWASECPKENRINMDISLSPINHEELTDEIAFILQKGNVSHINLLSSLDFDPLLNPLIKEILNSKTLKSISICDIQFSQITFPKLKEILQDDESENYVEALETEEINKLTERWSSNLLGYDSRYGY